MDMYPGIDKATSTDRLGLELADEQLKLIFGLRQVRVDNGMSVAEVAAAMDVDPAQVSRFESGATNPTMATIRRYAKAVGGVFRVETREWPVEQTLMVKRAVTVKHFNVFPGSDEQGVADTQLMPQVMLR
nr:helix-turn-helix transcriptional regulator [Mycobacterium sp. UM_NZ2]